MMVKVVNNELEGTKEEAVMASFEVLTRQLSEGTNENYRKIKSGKPGLTHSPKCRLRRLEIPPHPQLKSDRMCQTVININNKKFLRFRDENHR
jgi:hypothetical protein